MGPCLLQVLFFIPAVRKAMLSITPDPDKEFSLSCEMSLLFRMLYTARGSVCQASNLFRCLLPRPPPSPAPHCLKQVQHALHCVTDLSLA